MGTEGATREVPLGRRVTPHSERTNGTVPFSIESTRSSAGRCRIAVSGEIDLYVAGDVAAAIERAEEERAEHIVVDLTHVPFLDSSGVGALLAASRRLGTKRLTIVAPGRELRRVLEVTGVDRVLHVVTAE